MLTFELVFSKSMQGLQKNLVSLRCVCVFNIALILIGVHYFEAESRKKTQLLQAKCTKLHI